MQFLAIFLRVTACTESRYFTFEVRVRRPGDWHFPVTIIALFREVINVCRSIILSGRAWAMDVIVSFGSHMSYMQAVADKKRELKVAQKDPEAMKEEVALKTKEMEYRDKKLEAINTSSLDLEVSMCYRWRHNKSFLS